jgi:hypothetical protein
MLSEISAYFCILLQIADCESELNMKTKIKIISAMPGSGKSWWAHKVKIPRLLKSASVLLCMPTKELISEVSRVFDESKIPYKEIHSGILKNVSDTLQYQLSNDSDIVGNGPNRVILATHEGLMGITKWDVFDVHLIIDEALDIVKGVDIPSESLRGLWNPDKYADDLLPKYCDVKLVQADDELSCGSSSTFFELMPKSIEPIDAYLNNHRNASPGNDGNYNNLDSNGLTRTILKGVANYGSSVFIYRRGDSPNLVKYEAAFIVFDVGMLENFKSILLMSAFIRDTEMFHFIKVSPSFNVDDITGGVESIINRNQDLINRYKDVEIYYALDRNRPFSKNQLDNTLILTDKHYNILDKYYAREGGFGNLMQDHVKAIKGQKVGSAKVSEVLASALTPITYFSQCATTLFEGKKCLVNTNIDKKDYLSTIPRADFLSIKSHGQNQYKQYKKVAIFGAYNPRPTLGKFYLTMIPEYDPFRGWYTNNVTQTLARSKVRNAKSRHKIKVLVSTKGEARHIRRHLLGLPIVKPISGVLKLIGVIDLPTSRDRHSKLLLNLTKCDHLKLLRDSVEYYSDGPSHRPTMDLDCEKNKLMCYQGLLDKPLSQNFSVAANNLFKKIISEVGGGYGFRIHFKTPLNFLSQDRVTNSLLRSLLDKSKGEVMPVVFGRKMGDQFLILFAHYIMELLVKETSMWPHLARITLVKGKRAETITEAQYQELVRSDKGRKPFGESSLKKTCFKMLCAREKEYGYRNQNVVCLKSFRPETEKYLDTIQLLFLDMPSLPFKVAAALSYLPLSYSQIFYLLYVHGIDFDKRVRVMKTLFRYNAAERMPFISKKEGKKN